MNKIRVVLVEDWRHFYKWSSVRFQVCFALVAAMVPHLLVALQNSPPVIAWLSQEWPSLLPVLQHFFPNVQTGTWVAVGSILTVLLRVTSIQRPAAP